MSTDIAPFNGVRHMHLLEQRCHLATKDEHIIPS